MRAIKMHLRPGGVVGTALLVRPDCNCNVHRCQRGFMKADSKEKQHHHYTPKPIKAA